MREGVSACNVHILLRNNCVREFVPENAMFSVNAAIGQPQDQTGDWGKVTDINLNKVYTFLGPMGRVVAFVVALRVIVQHGCAIEVLQPRRCAPPS